MIFDTFEKFLKSSAVVLIFCLRKSGYIVHLNAIHDKLSNIWFIFKILFSGWIELFGLKGSKRFMRRCRL